MYFSIRNSSLIKRLVNIPGWKTDRKLIIIESDDWGSIRMPSLKAFQKLEIEGLDLRSADAERFNMNDTIASASDLEHLFEVLDRFRDIMGNPAAFTPVTIVANPDFRKIAEQNFTDYYYEPFTTTLERYTGNQKAFKLWQEGILRKLFIPQLHGREHLNVNHWMMALRNNDPHTRLAFIEGVTGFVPDQYPIVDYQAAFQMKDPLEFHLHSGIIIESISLFEKIFGYKAEYFVPPNGVFNNRLNKILADNGVKLRSVARLQNEPSASGKRRKILHWLGEKDKYGIRYITRNCLFEPSQPGRDWVSSCLRDINNAFICHQPAIISTHRVNFIGSLNQLNRDKGLTQLSLLLEGIKKNFKESEFITTRELGDLMTEK